VRLARLLSLALCPAMVATAIHFAGPAGAAAGTEPPRRALAEAYRDLEEGEADSALDLLGAQPTSGPDAAEASNLVCRVRYTLRQWDAAISACQQAVEVDGKDSDYHLWLGRALGEKAAHATFLTAYSLAKRARVEFEQAVELDPRNADALADLGDFYRQAPGVLGGGIDKARAVAIELDKVDATRAEMLQGQIAEQRNDYAAAEALYKMTTGSGPEQATGWVSLASFYARRQRFDEMETAVHDIVGASAHDKHGGVALYDGAGLLIETKRDLALAAEMLENYLAGSAKSEEAPAFIAHLRLARLKQQLGDPSAAGHEQASALAMAREYNPAPDEKMHR
jgi:tetratricopeptide (TPR) repeat protein